MSNDGESSGSKNLGQLLGKFDPMAVDLAVAGNGLLRVGLDHMHEHKWGKGAWVQPAVANMAIGIKLMCKSYLAAANPLLIFNKVDADIAWAVHKPGYRFDEIPYERIHTLMEAGGSKTIGLSGCIELLQTRFPKKVQSLGEWRRRLASWRAICVHFVMPDVETRAVQRVAFAALSIAQLLSEESPDSLRKFWLTDEDKDFLTQFDKEKAADLDARVNAAKKKVKNMKGRVLIGLFADDGRELTCEICGNDGIAYGERSIEDGYEMLFLSEFKCDECGLELYDANEMAQCGFETVHEIGPHDPAYD
jgi:uncharacterized ferredoxin-like protein